MSQPTKTVMEPLLLLWPSCRYRVGDFVTVDGGPAVIRKMIMDTGTVIRAEVEVYESYEAREEANR